MAIDIQSESTVTLSFAGRELLPQVGGRPVASSTVYRWIRSGAMASDGSRVRLEAVRIGRAYVTTKEAVQRFKAELCQRSGVRTKEEPISSAMATKLKSSGLL